MPVFFKVNALTAALTQSRN